MSDVYLPITLPSKGLLYEGVDPTTIQIRPLKGKDEKLIAEIGTENIEKKLLSLFNLIIKGLDPKRLTAGDRLYILVWEVINSYSRNYPVTFECGQCWQKINDTVDLGNLDIFYLPDTYNEPYEIKLPDSGDIIKLRLLRVNDLIQIESLEKQGQNSWLYRYALSIVDESNGIWDKVSYLENLSTKDLICIRGFHEVKFYHGPKMEYKYECPKCGGAGILPVPFRLEMFFPYGETLKHYLGNTI